MNYIEKVREFHEAFNIPVGDERVLWRERITEERHELRMSLIREELHEYSEALDDIDLLDAACDIVYVTAGYLVELGIEQDGDDEGFDFDFEGFGEIIYESKMYESSAIIDHYFYSHEKMFFLYGEAIKLICMARELSGIEPGGFNEAFLEVHRSNMAKLWTREDISRYRQEAAVGYPHEYRFIESKTPGKFIAYRKDGKVMKPPTWQAPDLKSIIERHEAS